jgi:chromosome partitioning protein
LREKVPYEQVMVESPYKNVWVIPSTKELKGAQTEFARSARGLKLFRHLLKGVEKNFDFVLIDTKPQINVLLQAALAASHWYLIPSFPEPDSYDGFLDLVSECEEIHEEENGDLKCLGVILSCVKKIPAHDSYVRFIGKHLRLAKVLLLKPAIRVSNAVASGSLQSCPAASLSSAHSVKEDYRKLTKALIRATSSAKKAPRPDLKMLGVIREKHEEAQAEWQVSEGIQEIDLL